MIVVVVVLFSLIITLTLYVTVGLQSVESEHPTKEWILTLPAQNQEDLLFYVDESLKLHNNPPSDRTSLHKMLNCHAHILTVGASNLPPITEEEQREFKLPTDDYRRNVIQYSRDIILSERGIRKEKEFGELIGITVFSFEPDSSKYCEDIDVPERYKTISIPGAKTFVIV